MNNLAQYSTGLEQESLVKLVLYATIPPEDEGGSSDEASSAATAGQQTGTASRGARARRWKRARQTSDDSRDRPTGEGDLPQAGKDDGYGANDRGTVRGASSPDVPEAPEGQPDGADEDSDDGDVEWLLQGVGVNQEEDYEIAFNAEPDESPSIASSRAPPQRSIEDTTIGEAVTFPDLLTVNEILQRVAPHTGHLPQRMVKVYPKMSAAISAVSWTEQDKELARHRLSLPGLGLQLMRFSHWWF